MSELKPCPFCGGEAYLESDFDRVFVECNGCNACTKVFEKCEDAVAAWDRRVGDLRERVVQDDSR